MSDTFPAAPLVADSNETQDRTNTSAGLSSPGSKDDPLSITQGDRYRLEGELARGGMGVVYRATDTAFGREVAIKVVGPDLGDTDAARRFVAEARITGQLQHPAIPPVHDLGSLPNGRPYLAMKLIKGRTLAAEIRSIREAGPLQPEDLDRLTRMFEQVCLAVAFAHSRRVIHRDLKPANVMVGAFGEVQVMDWGLAKDLAAASVPLESTNETLAGQIGDDPDGRTMAGRVMGTPAYMPPEQARGEIDHVDERADVFALGGILLCILTGRPPYVGANGNEAWNKAAAADLREAFARLEKVLGAGRFPALAKRCLNPDPAARPAHAGEVAAAVHSAREWAERTKRGQELTLATNEADQASRRAAAQSRRAILIGVAGLILGAACAAASWAYMQTMRPILDSPQAVDARRAAAKDQLDEVSDAVAHGLDANRFARGWDGPYRERMLGRVSRLLDNLDPAERVRANLVIAMIHDAAQERDLAELHWYAARDLQAGITPEHAEVELALSAVAWAESRKPFGDLERRILTRAAQTLRNAPRDLSESLAKRVAAAKAAFDQRGVKSR